MGRAFASANMQTSVNMGVLLLVASAQAQQMCLSSATSPGPDAAVTFDDISTLGTSTIEDSLVNISLANTTGEIKIKHPEGYSGANYFYLLVSASQKPGFSRKARLFVLVNGKEPLRGVVYFTHYVYGRLETKNSLRVVGINDVPSMPLGMVEFSEEEVTFGDMEFIHHGDTLRLMADSMGHSVGHVSVCIFFQGKSDFE